MSGSCTRRQRHRGSASVRPMSTDTDEDMSLKAGEGRGADLLTIGLLVFFVGLLLVVAALLVLPLIFPS